MVTVCSQTLGPRPRCCIGQAEIRLEIYMRHVPLHFQTLKKEEKSQYIRLELKKKLKVGKEFNVPSRLGRLS